MRFRGASALVPLLVPEGKTETVARLRELSSHWSVAEPTKLLRLAAERLVARHALRTGDAIPLASAAVAAEGADVPLEFVCFDRRLPLAAITEGLRVVPDAGG